MELVVYIRLFRKWFWLILLGAFLVGGTAFLLRSQQPDQYEAHVTIAVGSFVNAPNPDSSEIQTGLDLAQTYVVLAETYDVLEAAIEAKDFPVSPAKLGSILEVQALAKTSLLKLTVTYTDPTLAADMANEVAQQLILNSPSNLTAAQEEQLQLAQNEIERLDQELEQLRLQLNSIDAQLATTTDSAETERLMEQRNFIVSQINQASSNVAQFSDTIATLQNRTNSLEIVEKARVSESPTGSSLLVVTILGSMIGIALAMGVAFLIEYLDDTIRTPQEVSQVLVLPTLASITRFGGLRDEYAKRLITFDDPGSHVSEEYRTLRTNLLFSPSGDWSKGVYIITSPGPAEGKSVTTANLAVTMAMAGLRVLLVDADLRRPKIHRIFDLDNHIGLSTLLFAAPDEPLDQAEWRGTAQSLRECLQDTKVPGLRIIASGFIPSNPTEALGSALMQRCFGEFRTAKNVDIILFDTPPALVVADSSVLAAAIKAPVVFVIEAGHTRSGAALRAKEQFTALDISIKGVVLNAVKPRERGYGYGYGYDYYYYQTPKTRSTSSRNSKERG